MIYRPGSESLSPTSPPEEWTKQVIHGTYHPHIEGLRCLAVVPVILYHLMRMICPAGFLGVDIFFVISGYLICGGILRDLQNGEFSLTSFYHRRIRRIFPAYFAVVFCVLAASAFLYHWARLVPVAQTALFSVFFSTNLYFWLDMGYFQPNAHGNPLLNLWSLGVEEQFYIIAPIASVILWKIRRNSLIPAFLLLFIASLILCVFLGQKGQSTTVFYILPTRAWELLAGALLTTLPRARQSLRSTLLSFFGLALILFSFWCLSTEKTFTQGGTSVELFLPFLGSLGIFPFPGLVNLPVILGSLLLLQYGNTGPISQILCSRGFLGIGKISYSLYLWHWPVIVFSRYINYDHPNAASSMAVLLISFLLAYVSWRWVEMPVRISNRFTPRVAFASVGLGCGVLAAICLLFIGTDGLREQIHQTANRHASPPRPFLPNFSKFAPPLPPFQPLAYPAFDSHYIKPIGLPNQKPTFCLIGDSHAEALEPGLDAAALDFRQSGLHVTRNMHPFAEEGATNTEQRILDWIAANPDIRDVYVVGRWLQEFRIPDGMPALGDKGKIQPTSLDAGTALHIENSFRHNAQWFIRHGKRVYVFTTVPE